MARTRKSKLCSFGKFIVFLVEMVILGVALFYVFGSPVATEPSTQIEQPAGITASEALSDNSETTVITTTEPQVSTENLNSSEPEITVMPTATPAPAPKKLALHQISVGCANAYLLQYGDTNIFIDGGLSGSLKTVESYLEAHGVSHLDAYIGTHWHGDHTDNAAELLSRYGDANTVLYGPSESVDGLVKMLRERVYSKKSSAAKLPSDVKYVQFKAGDTLTFGNMELICVGPYEIRQDGACNYDSMNFVIRYGDFKAFMTGDYVHSKQVLESYGDIVADVDILQMPHHGLDPIYISKALLKLANPEVILVPANSSGPTGKLIRECGLDCVKYDNKSGNIVITTYGEDFELTTSK